MNPVGTCRQRYWGSGFPAARYSPVPQGEGVRLYCFTFAGGTASSFFSWRNRFGPDFEVCPIEYPGRGGRWNESHCATMEALVEAIAGELSPALHQPFAFLGHSFGGIVAFETTKLLNRQGFPMPVRLLVSGARGPHLPQLDELHNLPEEEFLERLMTYGGIPQEALENSEMLTLLLPIARHDFRLLEGYRYIRADPLSVPISVFGGLQDPKVSTSDLLAWSQHTTKSFRSHFFPGKHFFLYDQRSSVIDNIQDDIRASTMT